MSENQMKANPGGKIAPENVLGRERIIELIWDTLEQQSVIKTAERRIGKTTIADKMLAEPRAGWHPVFQDLERFHTANDFAISIYKAVDSLLTKNQRAARRSKEFFTLLGGSEIGGVLKIPALPATAWKEVLTQAIRDLHGERSEGDNRIVFLWDEMPYMLEHIRDREGENIALEMLDVLRGLRQEYGVRMVITGSVGIHHVLKTLSKKAETSINDLFSIEIPPLDPADAAELAKCLIRGEGIPCPDTQAVARVIAKECDHFPFYIHHVVKALKVKGGTVKTETVKNLVAAQLVDDNDPWKLYHYRQRLGDYYGEEESTVCLMLDEISISAKGISPNELLTRLKGQSKFSDREKMLELLRLLVRDHYLARDEAGLYTFRFTLIQRWWASNRGLK